MLVEGSSQSEDSSWYKNRTYETIELNYILRRALRVDLTHYPLFRVDETTDEARDTLLTTILTEGYSSSQRTPTVKDFYSGKDKALLQLFSKNVEYVDATLRPRVSTSIESSEIPDAIMALIKWGIRNWDFAQTLESEPGAQSFEHMANLYTFMLKLFSQNIESSKESFREAASRHISMDQAHRTPNIIQLFSHSMTEIICKWVEQGFVEQARVLHNWLSLTRRAIINHKTQKDSFEQTASMLAGIFINSLGLKHKLLDNENFDELKEASLYTFTTQVIALCLQNSLFDDDFDEDFYRILNQYILKRKQLKDLWDGSDLESEASESQSPSRFSIDSIDESASGELAEKLSHFSLGDGLQSLSLDELPQTAESWTGEHFVPWLKVGEGMAGQLNLNAYKYYFNLLISPSNQSASLDLDHHHEYQVVSFFEGVIANVLKVWGAHDAQQVHNLIYILRQVYSDDLNPQNEAYGRWLMSFFNLTIPEEGVFNVAFYQFAVDALLKPEKSPFNQPFSMKQYDARVSVSESSQFYRAAWFEAKELEADVKQLRSQNEILTEQLESKEREIQQTKEQVDTLLAKLNSLPRPEEKNKSPSRVRRFLGRSSKADEPTKDDEVKLVSSHDSSRPKISEKTRGKSAFALFGVGAHHNQSSSESESESVSESDVEQSSPPKIGVSSRGKSSLALVTFYKGSLDRDGEYPKEEDRNLELYASPTIVRKSKSKSREKRKPRKSVI